MIKSGSEFNELVLKDGTIVNFRNLRAASQFQFTTHAVTEKIEFCATSHIRPLKLSEQSDELPCPYEIVWTLIIDEQLLRKKLDVLGMNQQCPEEFFSLFQNGTGKGCYINRKPALARVELRFDAKAMPSI